VCWVIGMDLGGTNLRAAQVDPTGILGATRQALVEREGDATAPAFGQLLDMLSELVDDAAPGSVAGIGVSVTGPVDPLTGWVDNPFTLPPSMQGDLVAAIRSGHNQPVAVENDANAAALGEARFGAGRGGDVVVCVTVGTGIGVGVVAHGRLYEGAARAHAESGHLVVDPAGPPCYCGASGCLESLASATAIARAAVEAGVVADGATAREVHRLAQAGVVAAADIVDRAHQALAAGIRTLVAVYAPDVVVVAGNAQGDGGRLMKLVAETIESFPFGAPAVAIRRAALGNWAGCIGAASLLRVS